MFIDKYKEKEIKLESCRLKLYYYHDVMTSFLLLVLFIHWKDFKRMNFDENTKITK